MNLRNYVIGVLLVVILLMGSVIYKYKHENTKEYHHFPVPESLKKKSTDGNGPPLYLFLFFSKNDCNSCLAEIVEVINTLPSQFCTAGLVPVEELKDEQELRRLTGISYPLYSSGKFKKYLPEYTPTLFGVSQSGKVIFVLPGTGEQKSYLRNFLTSIYVKAYPSLEREQALEGGSPTSSHKK